MKIKLRLMKTAVKNLLPGIVWELLMFDLAGFRERIANRSNVEFVYFMGAVIH